MRGTDYEFVPADGAALLAGLIEKYETLTGRTLNPDDPDRLFICWVADVLIAERVNQNYIGNQNIPSRATGANLDALGKWIYDVTRSPAQPAKCTMRFMISEAMETAVTVPAGTRVTDARQKLYWETTRDEVIPIGETSVDAMAQCLTAGEAGNGFAPGQINTLVDVGNILYFSSCANVTASEGGADVEGDDAYYERMRLALDAYSTAGAAGAYIYHAKSVSDNIADVRAIRPVWLRTAELPVATDENGDPCAYMGGDQLSTSSMIVRAHGATEAAELAVDYTVAYTDGLLKIGIISGGALDGETSVDVSIRQDNGGRVYIYALMDDGNKAGETIKEAIATECNREYVRPLTDMVSVEDPEEVGYNIDLTFYVDRATKTPMAEIEAAVSDAVDRYVKWQYARLGRDINPAKLWQLLMGTGIKRAEIRAPIFRRMDDGSEGDAPELAVLGTRTVVNGGYEDE